MKLLKLKIKNYKLFENLSVDFQDSGHIAVFIGKNGSGKTTLIESLTQIFAVLLGTKDFKSLEKQTFPFQFSITYLLRREKITETSMFGESFVNYVGVEVSFEDKLQIKLFEGNDIIEGLPKIEKHLRNKGEELAYILPDNFVVYYSGISNSIYEIYTKFQRELITGTLTGEVQFDQPFYYFLPQNLPAILIGLLSYEYGDVPEALHKQFGISGFSTIQLNFKKPSWAKSKSTSEDFWGAMGELNQFMNILKGATKANFQSDSITFSISDKSQLENIWSFYGTEKRLFEYLVSLQSNDFLESIDLNLIKNGREVSFDNLSEGEKQLLIITGLKELLATDNSLFLLDEPDTYLHPEWKREFVYNLFKEDEDLFKNFSIITTHSPNILSALKKGQLNVFVNENGKSRTKNISFNPYGKPVDDILTDFFDLEGLRYKKVQQQLNDIWDFIRANNYESAEFSELFAKLEKDLGKSDKALTDIRLEITKRNKLNEKNK
ncbi:AAA family ATPase [Elizabethkingia anophelis]|uniref:AAA family ATPase n=1 Tax=Elizabethkingia anophelis TaxID=1117645 RepID=UPI002010EF73|nr:ATP-binding protein [Elizabethkingia anophelis]EJC8058501.1 AAA family ATPase [Elizabethkingia anophelis]MCL1640733.1 AAA family ATPase [Elizabethkingia anophelis]MCL1644849.1 AAA family ATPase [Elizabethkingia anophelis]MCT3928526.1 AAA family ATPase [Elizabethkingia anophelis]MCT4033376.1 AAA family ATPase [Elizabethkingia anophelis]